jgi:hypothetical protein
MPMGDWTKDMVTTPVIRRLIAAIVIILLTAAAWAGWWLTRVLPGSSPSQIGSERNLAMSDHPARPIAPMHGPENAAPWPVPVPPDASVMTFSGNGDATTQEFALPSDAALRIAAEKGPMVLRVLRTPGGITESPLTFRVATVRDFRARRRSSYLSGSPKVGRHRRCHAQSNPDCGLGAGRNPARGHLHARSANVGSLGRDSGVRSEQIDRSRSDLRRDRRPRGDLVEKFSLAESCQCGLRSRAEGRRE